jgi:hypothetical protein
LEPIEKRLTTRAAAVRPLIANLHRSGAGHEFELGRIVHNIMVLNNIGRLAEHGGPGYRDAWYHGGSFVGAVVVAQQPITYSRSKIAQRQDKVRIGAGHLVIGKVQVSLHVSQRAGSAGVPRGDSSQVARGKGNVDTRTRDVAVQPGHYLSPGRLQGPFSGVALEDNVSGAAKVR